MKTESDKLTEGFCVYWQVCHVRLRSILRTVIPHILTVIWKRLFRGCGLSPTLCAILLFICNISFHVQQSYSFAILLVKCNINVQEQYYFSFALLLCLPSYYAQYHVQYSIILSPIIINFSLVLFTASPNLLILYQFPLFSFAIIFLDLAQSIVLFSEFNQD